MAYNILICSYMREEGRIDINIVLCSIFRLIVIQVLTRYEIDGRSNNKEDPLYTLYY